MSARRHPALHPYLAHYEPAQASSPAQRLDLLNRWASEQALRNGYGQPVRFVHASGALHAVDYEWRIGGQCGRSEGLVETRSEGSGGDHDLLNALAWLYFPRTKACLNRCHVDEILQVPEADRRRIRSRARDRLTLFDENGAMLLTEDQELVEWLAGRQWQRLFLDERQRLLANARLIVFGHGLLQKCLTPFPSMTARVCVLDLPPASSLECVDEVLSDTLARRWPELPTVVLPVCGWPEWDAAGAGAIAQDELFYGNREVFRQLKPGVPHRMS